MGDAGAPHLFCKLLLFCEHRLVASATILFFISDLLTSFLNFGLFTIKILIFAFSISFYLQVLYGTFILVLLLLFLDCQLSELVSAITYFVEYVWV